MNNQAILCDVCGEESKPREWLRCMLCGRRYHFAPQGAAMHADCGIVAPNAQSQNGC